MYGVDHRMSPDDHYQDLKRIIGAIGGKSKKNFDYYAHAVRRKTGQAFSERVSRLRNIAAGACQYGVTNIITFDAHNASVMNAIPYHGFENVHPTYQMLKALVAKVPDISIAAEDLCNIFSGRGRHVSMRLLFVSTRIGFKHVL